MTDRDPPESHPINSVIRYHTVIDEFSYTVSQIMSYLHDDVYSIPHFDRLAQNNMLAIIAVQQLNGLLCKIR